VSLPIEFEMAASQPLKRFCGGTHRSFSSSTPTTTGASPWRSLRRSGAAAPEHEGGMRGRRGGRLSWWVWQASSCKSHARSL
jgi:hypothetical protein